MFGYWTNPQMHTTFTPKAVNQSHDYNTRLASNILKYSLSWKRTKVGKNSVGMFELKFGTTHL